MGIIFVELTKLGKIMNKPVEAMTGEEAWALFLAVGSEQKHKDLLDRLMVARKEITMAREILQAISKNDDERARFRARRKFQMDLQHSFLVAKDEGKAEGKQEQEIAIAKNALKMSMPISDIEKLTGLSTKEIEALREPVAENTSVG